MSENGTLVLRLQRTAEKHARSALSAYARQPPDYDEAVLFMGTAVEHFSKARLAAIHPVLIAPSKPSFDQLLILVGRNDLARIEPDSIATAGAEEIMARCARVRDIKMPPALDELRDARNGVIHLGVEQAAKTRSLLAAGILFINELIGDFVAIRGGDYDNARRAFWGNEESYAARITRESISETELVVERKLAEAQQRHRKRRRFTSFGPTLEESVRCPACSSAPDLTCAENDPLAEWYDLVKLECAKCGLVLQGEAELQQAGIETHRKGYEPEEEEDDQPWLVEDGIMPGHPDHPDTP
jgi:hypothetical protein